MRPCKTAIIGIRAWRLKRPGGTGALYWRKPTESQVARAGAFIAQAAQGDQHVSGCSSSVKKRRSAASAKNKAPRDWDDVSTTATSIYDHSLSRANFDSRPSNSISSMFLKGERGAVARVALRRSRPVRNAKLSRRLAAAGESGRERNMGFGSCRQGWTTRARFPNLSRRQNRVRPKLTHMIRQTGCGKL